jgi:hypothetical protein
VNFLHKLFDHIIQVSVTRRYRLYPKKYSIHKYSLLVIGIIIAVNIPYAKGEINIINIGKVDFQSNFYAHLSDSLHKVTEIERFHYNDENQDSIYTSSNLFQLQDEFDKPNIRINYYSLYSLDRLMPDDPMELYVRAFVSPGYYETEPSLLIRPTAQNLHYGLGFTHPWVKHPFFQVANETERPFSFLVFSPKIFRSLNTEIPSGANDGALWQGKGVNYTLSTGVGAKYGPLTIVFRPSYHYSENREFNLSIYPSLNGLSPYAMPLSNIDMPQRFGEESLESFNLGDSFIQLDHFGFAAGFSNQRIWTGPAVYNPLILSYNAPGFLHAYIGTKDPFRFRYGQIETKWYWGSLRESDYFDEDLQNDKRYITGLNFVYSPNILPGLHFGINRTAYSYFPDNGLGVSELLMALRLSQTDNETDPQKVYHTMTSFFVRWVFPDAGFEMYTEWGRNDNKRRLRDLFAEPELNRGYVMGFIKSFHLSHKRKLLLNTEITNTENASVASQGRQFNTWYEHRTIRQGFTNDGQVLGASIGPGSSTQQVRLGYYDSWGYIGVSGKRVAMYNDRFHRYKETYRNLHRWPQFWFMIDRHMVQMNYGFHGIVFLPFGLELQMDYHVLNIENNNNQYLRDVKNNQFQFTVRYNLWGSFQ